MNKVFTNVILSVIFVHFINPLMSQGEIVSSSTMNYVDSTDRSTYRTPQEKDIAIVINSTINSGQFFDQVGSDILNTDDNSGINRLVEQFVPSYRYYLDSKTCVSFGLLLSRKTQEVAGDALDTNLYQTLTMQSKSRSVSLRLTYDKHSRPLFFRHFDLDTYGGAAFSIGRTKSQEVLDADYFSGDYDYQTVTTPGNAAGLELYTGLAMRFDIISIGIELLAIGLDHQWGFGVSDVNYDYNLNGSSESGQYLVNSGELPGLFTGEFSSLNAKSTTTSMYRGIRLNLVLHIK